MEEQFVSGIQQYWLGPLTVHDVSRERLIELVGRATEQGASLAVTYVNAHGCNLLFTDSHYAATVAGFDLVFCDGVGAMLAFRFLGAPVAERMTPPDFLVPLLRRVAERRAFFVGDEFGVAQQARGKLPKDLQSVVVGCHHGFFDDSSEADVLERIEASGARLILVGTGMPRQEAFIERARLRLPGRVWFAVGALFRWTAEIEQRGPRWATDNGLEWLCRLMTQPRKVAGRYLVGLPLFGARVVRLKALGRRFEPSSTQKL